MLAGLAAAAYPLGGGFVPTRPSDSDTDLIAYWLANEGSGTDIFDSFASWDGTLSGGSWVTDSPFSDDAVRITGTGNYTTFGNITDINGLSATTINWWQRLADVATTNKRILGKVLSSSNRLFQMEIWGDGITYLSHQNGASTSRMTYTSASYFTTDWQMCTIVYDGSLANSQRLKLYVNGVLASGTVVGTIPTASPTNSASFIWGLPPSGVTNQDYSTGSIYDVAKSSTWVQAQYDNWVGP